ncbi:MAG: TlpA family protein disulfide reductase [Actinobacteria bacterium]|nr:TlpA family protein disulfide reductase [Actinomycetota bacterium]
MSGGIRLGGQALALGVVVALLGLLIWKVAKGDDNSVTGSLAAGKPVAAPNFTLAELDGSGELSLESLRGKAVVLNFWASWCGPCKDETPLLQKSWERWQGKDVVFVGIDVKDFRGDARAFVRKFGVTYPNVYDGKGSTIGRYGVTGFPETYFIDPRGRVVYRIAGPVDEASELDDGIERALAAA